MKEVETLKNKLSQLLENDDRNVIFEEIISCIINVINDDEHIPGAVMFLNIIRDCGCNIKKVSGDELKVKGQCYLSSRHVRKKRLWEVTIEGETDTKIFACDKAWVLPFIMWGQLIRSYHIEDEEKRNESIQEAYQFFKSFHDYMTSS